MKSGQLLRGEKLIRLRRGFLWTCWEGEFGRRADRQKGPAETLSLFREASLDPARTQDGQEGGYIERWSQ